jgi:phosphomannomutase
MDLFERAARWIAEDPDETSRRELNELVATARAGNEVKLRDLADRFIGPLEFGTAGLRGVLGAGETRMNRAVVRRTTLGLARYVVEKVPNARARGIVIGYDGRRMSREFAEDAACVLAEAGVIAHLTTDVSPTPVTAYTTAKLNAAAGVMVTASHNPPEYNGYKVYWTNAAQIIPPHDKGIAAAIDTCPPAKDIPLANFEDARKKGLIRDVPAQIEADYIDAVLALRVTREGVTREDVTKDASWDAAIVYTALHGVGDRLVHIVLSRAGFSRVHSVKEQAEPNGEFPTVNFPNPEEKGALDLSYALANKHKADIIKSASSSVITC